MTSSFDYANIELYVPIQPGWAAPAVQREELLGERFFVYVPFRIFDAFLSDLRRFVDGIWNMRMAKDFVILHHQEMVDEELRLRKEEVFEWIVAYQAAFSK